MKINLKRNLVLGAAMAFFLAAASLPSAGLRRAPQQENPPTRPVVAWVYFSDFDELNRLAGQLDVWDVQHEDGYLVALLRPEDYTQLVSSGYRVEVDAARTAAMNRSQQRLPGRLSGIPGYPCYRTVEETYAALDQLATYHPTIARLVDIGNSWEKVTAGGLAGYDLFALVITNRTAPGPKPKFFLMATIHAREYATAELATRFAEYLVNGYGISPDITWLIDHYEIHIVPQANPDGRKIAEGGDYWRKNTDNDDGCNVSSWRGVDLNRNSSFKWAYDSSGSSTSPCAETYRGPGAASEPETQAIQNYAASIFPDQRGPGDGDPAPDDASGVFLTLHSSGEWVLFPWGYVGDPAPNNPQLETLARKFGYFTNYETCQSGEPGCIYLTNGTTDDWAYGELGVSAYTFEVGTEFFQSCSYFEGTLLPETFPAMLFAFKSARLPYQNPAGPESLGLALSDDSIPTGGSATLAAVADDTRYDSNGWGNEPSQAVAAARYSLDLPSWQGGSIYPLEAVDGAFNQPVENLEAVIDSTGWPAGDHMLLVESQDAEGNWGVPSAIFLTIEPESYAVGLKPSTSTAYGQPGESVQHTLHLTNLGTVADSFALALSGNAWETILPASPIGPLEPGEMVDLLVSVTIPGGATEGMSDTATITAISQGDESQSANVTLTTAVRPQYGFELSPLASSRAGRPGELLVYRLALTNIGVQPDSYSTSLEGDPAWETNLSPLPAPIPSGETAMIVATVLIPPDAAPGDQDQVEVSITSQGNPQNILTATLTSQAHGPWLYLPLVRQ